MPSAQMEQILGSTKSWNITGKANGQPVLNLFVDSDSIDAQVYEGEGLPSVLTPVASWISAPSTTLNVAITAANLATSQVTPGLFLIEIGATASLDGQRRVIHRGPIKFIGTSGSGSIGTSLVTFHDILTYASDVSKLERLDVDQTGFASQRAKAMNLFVQVVVKRYNPRAGCSRRYLNAGGTGAGAYLNYAPSPDGSPSPTREQIEAWMVPGRLVVTEDIIEANARIAASLIYGSSPGQNNPYQQMAATERKFANEAIKRAIIEIDAKTQADGSPTIRIDRDVIYLT